MPILKWLPQYNQMWLSSDLLAGLTVWGVAVPHVLAYAALIGVPATYGFYASAMGLLIYAVFGQSRLLSTGPSFTIAALTASVITATGVTSSNSIVFIAALVAFVAGVLLLAGGLLRLGWITHFLANSVLTGFIAGLAILIMVSQLRNIFRADDVTDIGLRAFLQSASENPAGTVISSVLILITIGSLVFFRNRVGRWPLMLLILIAGLVLGRIIDFEALGVATVGPIMPALPTLSLPDLDVAQFLLAILGGLVVAIIGFSETISSERLYKAHAREELNVDQELLAQGLANIGSSLLSGFCVDGSLSKTASNAHAGAKSQLAGIFHAILMILTLLLATSFFSTLPWAIVGAIVLASVFRLIQVGEFQRLYNLNRSEFWLAIVTTVIVVFVGAFPGILIGIALSVLLLLYRASVPGMPLLGRVPGSDVFRDLGEESDAEPLPGIAVLRFDGLLYFATAYSLRSRVREMGSQADYRAVIVDCSAMFFVDIEGADMLKEIKADLADHACAFYLAHVPQRTLNMLEADGVVDVLGAAHICATIRDAVAHVQAT
ncbi:MAG: SulP family inorganic anion transporter [Anaerolineae bacterium]|nr:SulP family inorganic anion transporter [Anaerolineae bacterium]